MQSTRSLKKSTDTLYEIKAPLASFDTIDLDDDEQYLASDLDQSSAPEKGLKETAESSESNSQADGSEISPSREALTPTKEPETPTPTEESEEFNDNFVPQSVTDDENNCAVDTSTESKDANSSENNASAEEITTQLKVKGRKYREKDSKVKYEQIENTSDISDQEKTENISPLPTLKLKATHKGYDSESDSSDSDSGYIRSGFISATKGTSIKHIKDGKVGRPHSKGRDSNDSDSTPYSSPKVSRPVLPPPLTKEESAIVSKRKAYEKRLQRLQVTTNPIERPRSTTPINIHGLEEYASISSPEKSPGGSNLEKLKIKLPREDSFKGRSPRKSSRATPDSCSSPVFSFNEDLLFTHTRSAILVEQGLPGHSPKRVLVPPTLSPKLSPACSPQTRKLSTNSPRYFFTPKTSEPSTSAFNDADTKSDDVTSSNTAENWATFEDVPATLEAENADKSDHTHKIENSEVSNDSEEKVSDLVQADEPGSPVRHHVSKVIDVNAKCEELNKDEVLTVQIEESGDSRMCDIKYEMDLK